jgi:phage repressor protein C with HTH and peptisase S24 domain
MNTKKALEKLEETERAWETHAPDDTFFGMTLAQFKAKVQLSRDARAALASIEQQRTAAINERDRVDKENIALEQNIAKAIAGDARYGDDSDFYEGTGRVRKSEKKSGLTRSKKTVENKA